MPERLLDYKLATLTTQPWKRNIKQTFFDHLRSPLLYPHLLTIIRTKSDQSLPPV